MRREPREPERSRTVIVRCVDCDLVMGVESGESPRTRVRWAICTRCVARRNGLEGAKTLHELGIY
ncbi:MAG TPA: hypothetical protein VEJ36_01120 [Nitrososphaerales archaeon]|nr:hypothetical protein [Nitrososphaerales archaeon]